ncbi:MAG: penicillin-binding protein 2 [Candidatus Shapirobacteria bacterium]
MSPKRSKLLLIALLIPFALITVRLFYWQVIKEPELKEKALNQTYKLETINPKRGKIFTSDGYPIVLNRNYYQLSVYKPNIKDNKLDELFQKIDQNIPNFKQDNQNLINSFIADSNRKWITFPIEVTENQKENLKNLNLDFQNIEKRLYPENNLAKDILGNNSVGGLEAYYDKQLKGKTGFSLGTKDGTGKTILTKKSWTSDAVDGRNLHTTINRNIQVLSERLLQQGLDRYTSDSGSITIINSKTGALLAMSTLTATSSATPSAFKNPAISDLFEPGSIFKPLIVTMALDKKSIDTNFVCTGCGSQRAIGKYTITNWDSELHPNSSLQDIIKNSDNIGMSYIIGKLGEKNFLDYYHKIGLDQKTGIDLQGEVKPLLKEEWPEIDLATASFGQGIAMTQINMLQAFNTIANNGVLVKPYVVDHFDENNKIIKAKFKPETKVFKPETTSQMKAILKYAVENGVVAKMKPKDLEVCAKSGTAQVAIKGDYTNSSTIASYIGFSPCENPKFTMIVTINNPKSSPWGSSTAAPIWFELASKINNLL